MDENFNNTRYTKKAFYAKLNQAKAKIKQKFSKDYIEYKRYLKNNFSDYIIEGSDNTIYDYNSHIKFHIEMTAPQDTIKYIPNKKMNIKVIITVHSADLLNMMPEYYSLSDRNIKLDIKGINNRNAYALFTNKTKQYLSIESITSYYKNVVFDTSNLNKELAPESTSTRANSNYTLFADSISNQSSFYGVTKNLAKRTLIKIGFALKYRINNTNVEKTIFSRKKYLYIVYINKHFKKRSIASLRFFLDIFKAKNMQLLKDNAR